MLYFDIHITRNSITFVGCISDREHQQSDSFDHSRIRSICHFSPSSPIEQNRQNVIQEIINTEAVYLNELLLVEQVRSGCYCALLKMH